VPEGDQQVLCLWSIAESNRLVGHIYDRPRVEDGMLMITSPVVSVRLEGDERLPVAVTASGTCYRLGPPAVDFGQEKADAFVMNMVARGCAASDGQAIDGTMGTTVIRLK
jgi:hypothetical protein